MFFAQSFGTDKTTQSGNEPRRVLRHKTIGAPATHFLLLLVLFLYLRIHKNIAPFFPKGFRFPNLELFLSMYDIRTTVDEL